MDSDTLLEPEIPAASAPGSIPARHHHPDRLQGFSTFPLTVDLACVYFPRHVKHRRKSLRDERHHAAPVVHRLDYARRVFWIAGKRPATTLRVDDAVAHSLRALGDRHAQAVSPAQPGPAGRRSEVHTTCCSSATSTAAGTSTSIRSRRPSRTASTCSGSATSSTRNRSRCCRSIATSRANQIWTDHYYNAYPMASSNDVKSAIRVRDEAAGVHPDARTAARRKRFRKSTTSCCSDLQHDISQMGPNPVVSLSASAVERDWTARASELLTQPRRSPFMANKSGNAYALTLLCPIRTGMPARPEPGWRTRPMPPASIPAAAAAGERRQPDGARCPTRTSAGCSCWTTCRTRDKPAVLEHLKSRLPGVLVEFSWGAGRLPDGACGTPCRSGDSGDPSALRRLRRGEQAPTRAFIAYIKKCQVTTTFFFNGSTRRVAGGAAEEPLPEAGVLAVRVREPGQEPADLQAAFRDVREPDASRRTSTRPTWKAGAYSLDRRRQRPAKRSRADMTRYWTWRHPGQHRQGLRPLRVSRSRATSSST